MLQNSDACKKIVVDLQIARSSDASVVHASGTGQLQANPPVVAKKFGCIIILIIKRLFQRHLIFNLVFYAYVNPCNSSMVYIYIYTIEEGHRSVRFGRFIIVLLD